MQRGLSANGAVDHLRVISASFAAAGAWDSALAASDHMVVGDGEADAPLFRYGLAVTAAGRCGRSPRLLGDARPPRHSCRRTRPTSSGSMGSGRTRVATVRPSDGRESLRASRDLAAPDLDRSLAAFETYLRGDHSGAAAELGRLERERAQLMKNDNAHTFLASIDRLAAGRWLAAAGDTAQALSLLHWTETLLAPHGKWILTSRMMGGPAMLEQARLEEGQGRAEDAGARMRDSWELYQLPGHASADWSRKPSRRWRGLPVRRSS